MKVSLSEYLLEYAKSSYYPFHMPGHKRSFSMPEWDMFRMDITEIDGFDNLHHAEGILKDYMEMAARWYGSDMTYYLVNGSTSGILSAILASVSCGGSILMARNCHKAAYHAILLNQLEVVYLYPEYLDAYEMYGAVVPEDIQMLLESHPNIEAVFITSPTYEGVVSDISAIAQIVHSYGIPLIVDEAHGAHFGMHNIFPKSAISLGADIVIQSFHKTLPALTQTAVLHTKGSFWNQEKIELYLGVFQTSSPSYLLLASAEYCVRFLSTDGKSEIEHYVECLMMFRKKIETLNNISLLKTDNYPHNKGAIVDISKICLQLSGYPYSGKIFYDKLRLDYKLQMELYTRSYIVAITSVMDSEEGFNRFWNALEEIDRDAKSWKGKECYEKDKGYKEIKEEKSGFLKTNKEDKRHEIIQKGEDIKSYKKDKKICMSIARAAQRKKVRMKLMDAKEQISGEFVYLYPPGIPFIVPGEIITESFIRELSFYKENGYQIQGLQDKQNDYIYIVDEE